MIQAPSLAVPRSVPAAAAPAPNVVHETETQRQHVRVRLPGSVELDPGGGQRRRARLLDVSAGGCAFELPRHGLRPGQVLAGTLLVNAEPLGFTLPVRLQVRTADAGGRVGCRFQDVGTRESGALRQLISATLAGETVTVGDVLRSGGGSFVRPRASRPAPAEAPGLGARLRGFVISLLALTLGITAFGYALKQVHHLLFVTSAAAGKVAGPVYTVAMPREGTFYSLVPADGVVRKGAALASFEAPVLDLVRGQSLAANLTSEQLSKMMSQMVKGTITSPCDCRVQAQFVANAQYAGRGQPLFELVPRELKNPYVMARFRFDQMEKIAPGTPVRFHVTGDRQERSGRISQLRVPTNADNTVGGDVIAMIEPSEPLPPDLVNRPAAVDVGGIARFNPLAVVSSMADGAAP